jgi:hypothetical protein
MAQQQRNPRTQLLPIQVHSVEQLILSNTTATGFIKTANGQVLATVQKLQRTATDMTIIKSGLALFPAAVKGRAAAPQYPGSITGLFGHYRSLSDARGVGMEGNGEHKLQRSVFVRH